MISLKDLENSNAYIISNDIKEDQEILDFLQSHGYTPCFTSAWYDKNRASYCRAYFRIGKVHKLVDISFDDKVTYYHLNEIQEYNQYPDELSIGDKVFIDTSKYPEIQGRIGVLDKIDNYKGKITYRVDIYGCSNNKSTDGLYLFDKSQITKVETKAGKEATVTLCDDRGYDAEEFDALYNAKFGNIEERFKEGENKMELLEIYRVRKNNKLNEELDKAKEKAWEKDPTYKTLAELQEKSKTKDGHYVFEFSFFNKPDAVEKEYNKIKQEADKKATELSELIGEVRAQLAECETYEQKINVLKAYEILDEKGRVNA